MIVTNPPFSLFRDFLEWIIVGRKSFLLIGNFNAVHYKEVFPRIRDNSLWIGATGTMSDMVFGVPKGTEVDPKDKAKAARLGYFGDFTGMLNASRNRCFNLRFTNNLYETENENRICKGLHPGPEPGPTAGSAAAGWVRSNLRREGERSKK